MIAGLIDHLWQSTLFALGAGCLTLLLRANGAGARYWLWFAASLKFLVPFALLTAAAGSVASHMQASAVASPGLVAVQQWMEPFGPAGGGAAAQAVTARPATGSLNPLPVLLLVWLGRRFHRGVRQVGRPMVARRRGGTSLVPGAPVRTDPGAVLGRAP